MHRYFEAVDDPRSLWKLVKTVKDAVVDDDPLYWTTAVGRFGKEMVEEAWDRELIREERGMLYTTTKGRQFLVSSAR